MAAVAPVNGPYWAVTFPSMILVIAGPGTSQSPPFTMVQRRYCFDADQVDMSFATGQLIVSNSVPAELQGIAGKPPSYLLL